MLLKRTRDQVYRGTKMVDEGLLTDTGPLDSYSTPPRPPRLKLLQDWGGGLVQGE